MQNRVFTQLPRWIVSTTYLCSGFIKLNDPFGFSIQLQQLLTLCAMQFKSFSLHPLVTYHHWFAFSIPLLEVLLGSTLLVHVAIGPTLWGLTILTLSFSCLTGYLAYLNLLDRCCCFGDALILTPTQSFWKNICILLLIATCIYIEHANLKKSFKTEGAFVTRKGSPFAVLCTTTTALGLGGYTFHFLPLIDFTPYKKGTNIIQLIQPKAPLRYHFVSKKNGVITTSTEPPLLEPLDELIAVQLLNPEDEPTIKNFTIWDDTQKNITDDLLQGKKIWIILHNMEASSLANMQHDIQVIDPKKQYTPYILIDTQFQEKKCLLADYGFPICMASKQMTQVLMKSDMGFVCLDEGTIVCKMSRYRIKYRKQCATM